MIKFYPNVLITLTFSLVFISANFAVTRTFVSGDWNEASSWSPSGLPADGDDIVIPSGTTVNVDCNCGVYDNMTVYVYGTMVFDNGQKITMTASSELHIFTGGSLTGGNGGSKFIIGGTTIYRGNDPALNGPILCDGDGCNGVPVALPVTLIDFVAEYTNDVAVLNWVTASELNNDYFIVQRKQEESWESIGEIHGFGTTNTVHYYQYDDMDVNSTEYAYYRLKQVDFDGRTELSDVLSLEPITIKGHNYSFVKIGNNVNVIFNDEHVEKTQIFLINASGEIIKTVSFNEVQKNQTHNLDLSELKKGWYVVGIVGEDNAHFEKMLFVE